MARSGNPKMEVELNGAGADRDGAIADISLCLIALDEPGRGGALDWCTLADGERARATRFAWKRDRRRFVARRSALRRLLAERVDSGADRDFVLGRFGRPALAGAAVDFSLSHRDERALLAISPVRRVGVDIERIDATRVEPGMLAGLAVAPLADAADRALAAGDPLPFFRIWTMVEALAKARGVGIAQPQSDCLSPHWLSHGVFLPDDDGVCRHWSVWSWQPEPCHIAALAWATAPSSPGTELDSR
jgi:4'-phosphopantetheinyl transferase